MLFSSAYRCRARLALHAAQQELCVPSGFAAKITSCTHHLAFRLWLKYRICSEHITNDLQTCVFGLAHANLAAISKHEIVLHTIAAAL